MKIVHVAQSAGGVAEYLYMLLKNNEHKEIENILVVSEDYKDQAKRFEDLRIQIFYIPMKREINVKSDFHAVCALRRLIKDIKPDVVYLHSSKAGAIGRIALFFKKSIKIVYNAHGWYFNADIGKKAKIYAFIEKILAIRADKIINISQAEYNSAIQRKIAPKEKMVMIANGIDFSKFVNSHLYRKNMREKYHIKDTDIVMGVVGRLSEQKDPIATIHAFISACKKRNNIYCMFIGSGELEAEVRKIAQENQLENKVIITGWISDTHKYIPTLDIALLPSKWEGFGLVILEYIACHKPIIATKVGGIQNLLADANFAILVETRKQELLNKALEEMLKDIGTYTKNVEENYEKYKEQYSIENVIEQHMELFNNLLNKKG